MDSMDQWIEAVHRKLEAERGPTDPPSCLYAPASAEAIASLEAELGAALPGSYRRLLERTDGWSGFWFGLILIGAASPARGQLETDLAEGLQSEEAQELLAGTVVLGANVEEDLYVLFDPEEVLQQPEPQIQIFSVQDGLLEVFPSFDDLMATLAKGDRLPRTVPLDLEQQFRPWEELEAELLEESGPDGQQPEA